MNCSATEQSRLSANRVLHGKPQLASPIRQHNAERSLHLRVGEHRIPRPAGGRLKLVAGDGDNTLGLQGATEFTGLGGPIEERFVVLKDSSRKPYPRGLLRGSEMEKPTLPEAGLTVALQRSSENDGGCLCDGPRPRRRT